LLYANVLEALKCEGDVAYSDTLLHYIVNDMAQHIESIMAANNLIYIVDMFFMVSHHSVCSNSCEYHYWFMQSSCQELSCSELKCLQQCLLIALKCLPAEQLTLSC